MPDAILIFTFSPVQSFISEARRAADLYAGSKILSRLANAAATPLQGEGCTLIFPANPNPDHTPNKLVARVPFERAEQIAQDAKQALQDEWGQITDIARKKLSEYEPKPDGTWNTIWDRQVDRVWEIYWVACAINGNDYAAAYKKTGRALDAVKRTRAFEPADEDGPKDTLSGRRSALRVADIEDLPKKEKTPAKICKEYWRRVYRQLDNPSLLRPDGKERLDTLGAVKRFCVLKDEDDKKMKFLSVSSIVTADYLPKAQMALAFPPLRHAIDQLDVYRVRKDAGWPYDGDLFFSETLTAGRLKDSYDLETPDNRRLEEAQRALKKLHAEIGAPSPYYAIIQLDGDSMGEKIDQCEDAEQHRKFSESLAEFAKQVRDIVEKHYGTLIYNGGDDVLALAPLSHALPLAHGLADVFHKTVKHPKYPTDETKNCTASAGIAIAHHLYPLDVALDAAQSAEKDRAKKVDGKNAVCVRVLKRSGETLEARSKWDDIAKMQGVVELFKADLIASKLAYDVLRDAPVVTALSNDARQATLKRLIKRHKTKREFDH